MVTETGTKLIPCEENPYYRLATVHGVPDEKMSEESSEDLSFRNLYTWNRYFAQGLNDLRKAELKKEGVSSYGIDDPLTTVEQEAIRKRLNGLEEPDYKEKIDFRKVQFELELGMEYFVFPNGVDFSKSRFEMGANFNQANFSGNADFEEAKFSDYANFNRAKFSSGSDFIGANFSGNADFKKAKFSGPSCFDGAKFSGEANFKGAEFSNCLDLIEEKFSSLVYVEGSALSGYADFGRAKFSGNACFEGVKFSGCVLFDGAKFSGEASFNVAIFLGYTSFSNAKFSGNAIFRGAANIDERREFGGIVNFRGAIFEKDAIFTNRVFLDRTTFDRCEFLNFVPNFAETKLHQLTTWRDVTWPSLPMIDKIEVKEDPNLDQAAKKTKRKETSRKRIYRVEDQVDAYRNLRLRMKQIENYQQEVFFLGKELDAKRRVHWLNKPYFRWFPSLVYKLFSDYGSSLARPAIGLVLLVVGFGLLVFWNIAGGEWGSLGGMDLGILLFQSLCFSGTHALPFISPMNASHSTILDSLPLWMVVPAGIAKTLGIGFLFLMGLALRNRFRIR